MIKDMDVWLPLAALVALWLAVSGCASMDTKQERLAHEAAGKLATLDERGCPSNGLFIEWSRMERERAPVPQWLYLIERLNAALAECGS